MPDAQQGSGGPSAQEGRGASVELTVGVGPMAHGGHCLARHEGRVVFVRHAVPGETVRVRIDDPQPGAKFWRGDVIEVLERSEHRRRHIWKLADALRAHQMGRPPVGGAEYGHMTDQHQRWIKAHVFRDTLQRVGGISVHDLASGRSLIDGELHVRDVGDRAEDGVHWRTRVSFAVDDAGALCMKPHRSHELIELRGMPLAVPAVNGSGLFGADFTGARTVDLIAPGGEGPLALVVRPAESGPQLQGLRDRLDSMARRDERVGTVLLAEQSPDGGRAGRRGRRGGRPQRGRATTASQAGTEERFELLSGPRTVTEPLPTAPEPPYGAGDLSLRPESFWQIHRSAPEALVRTVDEMCPLDGGESVADLYAGAGLFTAWAAARTGETGRVLSVEAAGPSAASAAERFGDHSRITLRRSPVEHVLGDLAGQDVVVMDPPRAGAGRQVIAGIDEAAPRRIVYVSCDPASFARDAAGLMRRGWRFVDLRVLDLYPNTHHMESVAVFAR
ncbi:MAG: class I SAM-dependent RNA methyltransferase [Nesterenkonia sp.]|nr:class I SAM-dependent RNA methyltransferase [Nesterenkonia sp.]